MHPPPRSAPVTSQYTNLQCLFIISEGKPVVKLTEETQLILGEVTRQLNLEKLLPTYRYVLSVR